MSSFCFRRQALSTPISSIRLISQFHPLAEETPPGAIPQNHLHPCRLITSTFSHLLSFCDSSRLTRTSQSLTPPFSSTALPHCSAIAHPLAILILTPMTWHELTVRVTLVNRPEVDRIASEPIPQYLAEDQCMTGFSRITEDPEPALDHGSPHQGFSARPAVSWFLFP